MSLLLLIRKIYPWCQKLISFRSGNDACNVLVSEHISIHMEIVFDSCTTTGVQFRVIGTKPWKQPIFKYEKNGLWPEFTGSRRMISARARSCI